MAPRHQPTEQQKKERRRTVKRNHMRRKRGQQKASRPTFTGPTIPHLNSLEAATFTREMRVLIKRIKNKIASRQKRDKKNLLAPIFAPISHAEMIDKNVKSWFALHANTNEYVLHLSNLEIYSSKLGSIYKHGREVHDPLGVFGPSELPKPTSSTKSWNEIPRDEVQHLDTQHDLLHVVRQGAPILQNVETDPSITDNLLQDGYPHINYSIMINGLMTRGVGGGDPRRSPDSFRISFGFNEFGDPTSFGDVDTILGKNAKAFKKECGRVAELLCATMLRMQIVSGNGPIWTNDERDRLYAAKLRNRLYLSKYSPMRAEMIAICCMKICPNRSRNIIHLDKKNPEEPGYNRSGTFSAVVAGENGDFYLFQVLVASRRYAVTLGKKGVY